MPKKLRHVWRIEIREGFKTVFRRKLPGNLSNKEIADILQRLICKKLTPNEIVSASVRKPHKSALLNYRVDGPPNGKRAMIWIPTFSDYIATYWREDETLDEPDIAE